MEKQKLRRVGVVRCCTIRAIVGMLLIGRGSGLDGALLSCEIPRSGDTENFFPPYNRREFVTHTVAGFSFSYGVFA